MDILEEIVAHKRIEIDQRKRFISPRQMITLTEQKMKDDDGKTPGGSMRETLMASSTGIISEFKRKSPSKGWIKEEGKASIIPLSYQENGASALSILTDIDYFGGYDEFIQEARHVGVSIPILYKNFVIEEYQLLQARYCGASAVLLIAACLTKEVCKRLLEMAHQLGLEVLLEMHNDRDFEYAELEPDPKGYLSDYYNSGYDRGHMCPAGDNKWSEKAMEDCFRITNMCPQDGGLNRGMWNSIEQQCRAWAKKYGKVYVVCGPIYLNQQHRKIGKNKVVVPEAFFKVVLCMEGTPKAIGFICRNQSQKGKKKTDFINTIDDVERITGYDFFSKLPDDIEDKVEAHADINEW